MNWLIFTNQSQPVSDNDLKRRRMPIKFIIVLLIAIGVFTISGWTCFSTNEYIVSARNMLNLEQGCAIRKSYER